MAEVKLTKEEKLSFVHSALCNGGLTELAYSGINLDYNQEQYNKAKQSLQNPCYEDILVEILKQGGCLNFVDVECDGEYSKDMTLQMIYDNIEKTPTDTLLNYIEENDDAESAYLLLQAILYDGEIIFG